MQNEDQHLRQRDAERQNELIAGRRRRLANAIVWLGMANDIMLRDHDVSDARIDQAEYELGLISMRTLVERRELV